MTRDEFDALVERIERRFGARPLALRIRVALLLALGYAGFLFWFLLVFLVGAAFFLGAVAIDTVPGLALLVLGSLMLAAGAFQAIGLLWVRLETQPGREVRADEAPVLFETLSKLRKALGTPRIGRVVVTPDFNAGVQLVPRLGVFGWPRSILYLGLPLLDVLSREETDAVLAHECAHLSARHGRFGAWIYRLRRTWERVFERLHEPAKSSHARMFQRVVLAFVDWHWPRFNAYAFVLSRANEVAADRFAAQWSGPAQVASSLWRIACQSPRIDEEFWRSLWQEANTRPDPPADVMDRLVDALAEPPAPADACRWMERAARTLTDKLDTHPSLADRLRALGRGFEELQAAGFPNLPQPSAAAVFFGDRLAAVRDDVQRGWQRAVEDDWRRRHGRAASLQRKLTSLEQAPRDPQSDPDVLWDKARSVLDLDGPDAAEPLLRQLLALRPTHSAANLVLGQRLLERGAPEGEGFLRRILAEDDDELIPPACEALARHFQSAGLVDRVQEVRGRLSRYQAALAAAHRERNMVKASDRFVPHDLAPDELAALQEVLARQPDLASAHLVRKDLEHFPRQRLFVLCVRSRAVWWDWWRADRDAALAARLIAMVRLPGRVLIIPRRGSFGALGCRVAAAPGSEVYPVRPCSSRSA